MSAYVRDVDLAARLGVSRTTLWRWARQGRFPAPVRLGPGTTRWSEEDVRAWQRAREQGAA